MSTRKNTISAALNAYALSAELASKAASTQAEYVRVVWHLELEIGDVSLQELSRSWIRQRRDEWAVAGHRAATIRLQVLKNVLAPAMSDGELPAGLFNGLQRVNRPHGRPEQNMVWHDAEVDAVIADCIDRGALGLARAVALGRYAGMGRQTICAFTGGGRYKVKLPRGAYQNRLRYIRNKGEVLADIPEDPRLTAILDQTEYLGPEDVVAFNRYGDPWKPRQLDQALSRVLERLAEAKVVRRGLTLHGLRHGRGVELAHAGASDAELMAQLAHTDEQSARVYRRQAARKAMADRGQMLVDAFVKRAQNVQAGAGGSALGRR